MIQFYRFAIKSRSICAAIAVLSLIVSTTQLVSQENKRKESKGFPKLNLRELRIPDSKDKKISCVIDFDVESEAGPVALSVEQFSFLIAEKDKPFHFIFQGKPELVELETAVFVASKDNSITIKLETNVDRHDQTLKWSLLPDGDYVMIIKINSGRVAKFDYQWLGQTFSTALSFRLPGPQVVRKE